jgi:hypothetical protein
MKAIKSLNAVLFMAIFAILIAGVTGWNAVVIFEVLFVTSFIPMPKGVALMAVTREVWQTDIVELLFPNNEFANYAVNADQYVIAGAVVHKPTAGAAATVKKNLTVFPQAATQRADNELTYALDTYYSLPRLIKNIDSYELSYDKRMSVVGQDVKNLVDRCHKGLLYDWAPAVAKTILTTGGDTAEDLIDSTATGTRKVFTKTEFKKAAKKLDLSNLVGRKYACLTALHYHQFFESLSDAEKTNFNAAADLKNGIVGMYMGVMILMRSNVLRYRGTDEAMVPVDETADDFAAAAGDRAASLFWNDMSVERARGDVEVFDDQKNPLYYGDVYSANARVKGKIIRAEGVWAVVEAIGA